MVALALKRRLIRLASSAAWLLSLGCVGSIRCQSPVSLWSPEGLHKEWPWPDSFTLLEFMAGFANLTKKFKDAGLVAFAYEVRRTLHEFKALELRSLEVPPMHCWNPAV